MAIYGVRVKIANDRTPLLASGRCKKEEDTMK